MVFAWMQYATMVVEREDHRSSFGWWCVPFAPLYGDMTHIA